MREKFAKFFRENPLTVLLITYLIGCTIIIVLVKTG